MEKAKLVVVALVVGLCIALYVAQAQRGWPVKARSSRSTSQVESSAPRNDASSTATSDVPRLNHAHLFDQETSVPTSPRRAKVYFNAHPANRPIPADPLDENHSFGIVRTPEKLRHQWPKKDVFPMLAGHRIARCLNGKRVLVLGHSHLHRVTFEFLNGMHLGCDGYHCLMKEDAFTYRSVYDPAVFGSELPESRETIKYRFALRNASKAKQDEMRYDIILVTRSMWDLVWYDTHPKDVASSYYEALKEVLDLFLKKEGGILVVYPPHHCRSEKDLKGCYTHSRVAPNRLATFSAVRRLEKELGVKITSMSKANAKAQNIVLFDPLKYTISLSPEGYTEDGHHLVQQQQQVLAEVILRGVFRCGDDVPVAEPSVSLALGTSFPASITLETLQELDVFDRKTKAEIPHLGGEKCRCGSSAFGAAGIHPACRNLFGFTQKRRSFWVEKYLQQPLVGATELQMGELITLICTKPENELLTVMEAAVIGIVECLNRMGTSLSMPGNLSIPLPPPPPPTEPFPSGSKCICKNAKTTVQGLPEPRCREVSDAWEETKRECKFVRRFR